MSDSPLLATSRFRHAWLTLLVLLASVCTSSVALAAPTINDLIQQLKSDDFRLRTQAALSLGATRDPAAVPPLCGALTDSNQTVKLAAVAGLGKLGRDEGATCLKKAKPNEKDSTVAGAMDKAVENIAVGGDPPMPGASAKYYVAIQVTNKTGRGNLEIERAVRMAVQEKLLANSAYSVAPRNETAAQAGVVVKGRKLTGYLMMASVEPFNYSGGNLTVQLKVTMATYPDRSIKAEFSPKLTQQQTPKPDVASENVLIKMASQTSVDSLVKVVASL